MALVGIELETLVSEPDALTTRPPNLTQQLAVEYDSQMIVQAVINSLRNSF